MRRRERFLELVDVDGLDPQHHPRKVRFVPGGVQVAPDGRVEELVLALVARRLDVRGAALADLGVQPVVELLDRHQTLGIDTELRGRDRSAQPTQRSV